MQTCVHLVVAVRAIIDSGAEDSPRSSVELWLVTRESIPEEDVWAT